MAIGNFDGVHLGHQALVRMAVAEAAAVRGTPVALTFDPHPAQVLAPDRAPETLLRLEQRVELLGELGVEVVAVLRFDSAVASLAPDAFAGEVLAGQLGARCVVVGERFRFGQGRAGDVAMLERLGRRLGFAVRSLAPVEQGGLPVSSSRVRDALRRGDVQAARALLGRPPFADGEVVKGDGRGRTLGVPTANLRIEGQRLPADGVYAGRVLDPSGGPRWGCVANLGLRPTFGLGPHSVEAHLLDFRGDLYGRRLRLEFLARLRGERRFEGRQSLLAQIVEDVAAARAFLEKAG